MHFRLQTTRRCLSVDCPRCMTRSVDHGRRRRWHQCRSCLDWVTPLRWCSNFEHCVSVVERWCSVRSMHCAFASTPRHQDPTLRVELLARESIEGLLPQTLASIARCLRYRRADCDSDQQHCRWSSQCYPRRQRLLLSTAHTAVPFC